MEARKAGMVGVNLGMLKIYEIPLGGVKLSEFGRKQIVKDSGSDSETCVKNVQLATVPEYEGSGLSALTSFRNIMS